MDNTMGNAGNERSRLLLLAGSPGQDAALQELLRDDYTLVSVAHCAQALNFLEKDAGGIDALVLGLLGENWHRALETMTRATVFYDVPVLVASPTDSAEDELWALENGANEFVPKSRGAALLKVRLNNLIEGYGAARHERHESRLRHAQYTADPLTGLLNRHTAQYCIEEMLRRGCGTSYALMLVDIDNFRALNAASGYLAGDEAIRSIATALASEFGEKEVIGRFEDDEFVVFVPDVSETVREKVAQVTQKLKYHAGSALPVGASASVGYVVGHKDNEDTCESLLRKADKALNAAKGIGRGQCYEFGAFPVSDTDDKRPVVLILSKSFEVTATIESYLEDEFRVVSMTDLTEAETALPTIPGKTVLVYIDASSQSSVSNERWDAFFTLPWMRGVPTMVICDETNFAQIISALQAPVKGVLTLPLDRSTFERRTRRLLEGKGAPTAQA